MGDSWSCEFLKQFLCAHTPEQILPVFFLHSQKERCDCLPSRKFFEMIREINDDFIHLEVLENKWVKISTNSGSYNIAGTDSEEYPSLPEFKNDNFCSISCDILTEAIEKTHFSIAQENENQFNLNE